MIALITFQSYDDLSDYKVFCVQGHKESKELKSYHVQIVINLNSFHAHLSTLKRF